MKSRLFVSLAVVAGLIASYALIRYAEPDGRALFEEQNCVKCHVLRGHGFGFIDLSNVTGYRTRTWLKAHIRSPRQHDPTIGMPSFGHLSDRQIDALVDHLEGKGAGGSH